MFQRLFSTLKQYKWTMGILSFIGLMLILLPIGIQLGIQKALQHQGADQISIEDVDFNLFTGRLTIKDLQIVDQQHIVLSADRLSLQMQLRALWQKHFLLKHMQLQHSFIQITQADPQSIQVAGIDIPLSSDKKPGKNTTPFFLFGLENLDIEDLTMELIRPNQAIKQTSYTLDKLSLNNLYMWDDTPARMILNSYLNHSRIATNFQLHLFSEHPKIVGTLKVDQLNLAQLPYLAEQPGIKANGELSTDLTFTAQLFPQGLNFQQQGDILINQMNVEMSPYQANWDSFKWSGDFSYIESEQDPAIILHGQAKLKNFNAQDIEKQLSLKQSLDANLNLVTLLKPDGSVNVTQTGRLQLQNVQFQQPGILAGLKQAQWQGEVTFDNQNTPQVTAIGEVMLKQAKIADAASRTELEQDMQANLNAQLTLAPEGMQLKQQGSLTLSNLLASQPPYQASLKAFNWQGQVAFNQGAEMDLQSAGKVDLQSLQTQNLSTKQHLIDFDKLSIADINIQQLQSIKLKKLTLQKLEVARQPKTQFISSNEIRLDQVQLNQLSQLELGTLTINGSQTYLNINKESEITQLKNLLVSLPQSEEPQIQPEKDTKPAKNVKMQNRQAEKANQQAFQYKWHAIQTQGKNLIYLSSEQFTKPFNKTIQLDEFKLGALNSQKPNQDTELTMQMTLDEFTKFTSKGQVQPLNPKVTANLTTHMDGLDLVSLSPASIKFLGYDINSGQLSADLETKLVENKIDAQNNLHLHKLKLTMTDQSKTATFQQSLSMPIDSALSLLRDKQDNINLKLPIKGDITDPQFKLQDVINTALGTAMKAATKTYLLLALQPFGAIALAGDYLLNQNLAVNLQPIEFPPGQSQLTPKMQEYLKKINTLLHERTGVQIKVCGLANEADRSAFLAQLVKQDAGKTEKPKESKEDKQHKSIKELVSDEQLLNLAENRNLEIKRYLLNLGSANSQVILCQPKLVADNTAPKIAVGI